MMIRDARRYLALPLVFAAVHVAGCMGAEEALPEDEAALDPAADEAQNSPAEDLAAPDVAEQDAIGNCAKKEFSLPVSEALAPGGIASGNCPVDLYFHPNNGSHGGWIESYRLCNEGGQNYRICTGGSAPVRYWNASSCGGTVQDYYPQGWSGWVQTGGGCC